MNAVSNNALGVKVKSSVILAALTANPALMADALGVDASQYNFGVQASYVLGPKDVQYKSINTALNGTQHRIVYINGTAAKAVKVVPTTIAYGADDGIFCVVYSMTAKDVVVQPPTTTDSSTGETTPTTTDALNTDNVIDADKVAVSQTESEDSKSVSEESDDSKKSSKKSS